MPILNNAISFAAGARSRPDDTGDTAGISTQKSSPQLLAGLSNIQLAAQPAGPPLMTAVSAAANPTIFQAANLGAVRPPILTGPIIALPQPAHRTATQLVRGAIDQLNGANPAAVNEAINAIRSRNLNGEGIMDYLERKVRVGEALNQLAKDWTPTTRADFAEAFQMGQDRLDAMDSIVSIAIVNDRDLEAEIRGENTPETTSNDLLENRRVVWQYPNGGTVLTPPYLILIAVEYQDVAKADDVVRSITDQLGTFQGFKLPKAAIQKL